MSGFEIIENLENYTDIKSIWMESNGIIKIQGLDHMTGMRCLYLHQNKIPRMENLLTFVKLAVLNLSHNKIRVVEGLENCLELGTVDLSHNEIENITDCDQLKELPKLAHLDLKANKIGDKDEIVPFVAALPEIISIYLLQNPCLRMISNLRRQLTLASPTLYYLDDRAITELDRRLVLAFEEGGKEAELVVRKAAELEHYNKLRCGYVRNQKIEDESVVERKKQFKIMMAEVKIEKETLTVKLASLIKQLKQLDPEGAEFRKIYQ